MKENETLASEVLDETVGETVGETGESVGETGESVGETGESVGETGESVGAEDETVTDEPADDEVTDDEVTEDETTEGGAPDDDPAEEVPPEPTQYTDDDGTWEDHHNGIKILLEPSEAWAEAHQAEPKQKPVRSTASVWDELAAAYTEGVNSLDQ